MRLKVAKRGLFLSKRLHGATMQLDLIAYAEQRRDHGIQRAVDHAERESEGWTDFAVSLLRSFASRQSAPFLAEDFVEWATNGLIAYPADGRAFGGVFQRAAREGIIRKVGYAPARSSNLAPKCTWVCA